MSAEALIMIIRYCAQGKGANIGYRYILTVARDWAMAGFVTPKQVQKRLQTYNNVGITVSNIMKALG